MPDVSDKLLTIGQAAKSLNRKPRTLRQWEADGFLPEHLFPSRDGANRRVYTADQVEHIREWLIARGRRHNAANLVNYKGAK